MKVKPLALMRGQLRRLLTVGALVLCLVLPSGVYSLNTSAVAASLYSSPIMAASSMANQVKDQVDNADQAMMSAKETLDEAGEKTSKKAKEIANKAKGKAQKDIAKTKAAAKDAQASAGNKAKRDIAKTQEAAEKTKSTVVSRAKQDVSKTDNALEKAGNKAEEFASNALDAAKNLIGQ
jgi:isoleucyl-tRNA synthetase